MDKLIVVYNKLRDHKPCEEVDARMDKVVADAEELLIDILQSENVDTSKWCKLLKTEPLIQHMKGVFQSWLARRPPTHFFREFVAFANADLETAEYAWNSAIQIRLNHLNPNDIRFTIHGRTFRMSEMISMVFNQKTLVEGLSPEPCINIIYKQIAVHLEMSTDKCLLHKCITAQLNMSIA